MEHSVDDIKKDVRITINQNMSDNVLINVADIDTLSIDDIIRSKIVEATKEVECNANPDMIDNSIQLSNISVNWKSATGVGMGSITLPDDFMRLLIFQMSDWSRPASIITEDSPLYAQQSSRYPGIRGCPQRPVVAICRRGTGLVLEFYSCSAGASVFIRNALYIQEPEIKSEKINVSEKLYKAIVYKIASLTCVSLGLTDAVQLFETLCKELM